MEKLRKCSGPSATQSLIWLFCICVGDVAELDAYPDESFAAKQKTRLEKKHLSCSIWLSKWTLLDGSRYLIATFFETKDVLIENGAMTFLGSAAAMCTIFRRHLLRMLRPQGLPDSSFPMFSHVFPCFPVFLTCDWNNFDCQSTLTQSIYKFREDRHAVVTNESCLQEWCGWVVSTIRTLVWADSRGAMFCMFIGTFWRIQMHYVYIYICMYISLFICSPHSYQLMRFSILAKKHNFLRVASLSPSCLPLVPLPPFWILFHHGCRC